MASSRRLCSSCDSLVLAPLPADQWSPQLPHPLTAALELFKIGKICCGPTQLSTSTSLLTILRADSNTPACSVPPAQNSHFPCAGISTPTTCARKCATLQRNSTGLSLSPFSISPLAGHIPHSD